MTIVSSALTINAPAEQAWNVIADYGNVYRFHPSVKFSSLVSSVERGVGARRRCDFYDKTIVVEEVTEWSEGEGFVVELSGGTMPFEHAHVQLKVRPIEEDSTLVTYKMEYKVKYGLVGRIMDALIIRRKMSNMFINVLKGMEYHVITGDTLGKNGVPENDEIKMSMASEV